MQQLLPRAAEQNSCASSPGISQRQDVDKKHDEEFSSLTLDIHHSIHQLNQLILDLDHTFVPISTKPSCLSRAGGADTQTLQTGSLGALVCQHSITPLALPCKLIIPDRDPLEDTVSASSQSITNSAAELLKQRAACNVWFLGSVEMESLTGFQAVQKATAAVLSTDSLPSSTAAHFKVSSQGITLTDKQRKLFFRRHYAVNTVIFCALDPQDRKWKRDGCSSAKIFGFVARKAASGLENVCHVFAEHDPKQPASAIINFISKVMIGSQGT
uniref:PID domain-containing protein n=1 Tax=Cyprinus carpio carpio TaxID=630221 RepID=A0A9J7WX01_CYPCA